MWRSILKLESEPTTLEALRTNLTGNLSYFFEILLLPFIINFICFHYDLNLFYLYKRKMPTEI